MDAMQYGVVLPADYDMQSFRQIVQRNGHLLDDRKGLGFKAYLMRERGKLGSPVNYYGSFYLWTDPSEMARFLVGGAAFERIVRGLHRLSVEHWIGLASVAGPARQADPVHAVRTIVSLPERLDRADDGLGLAREVEAEVAALQSSSNRTGLHTAALALDPKDWRLIRFEAWTSLPPHSSDDAEHYEILHVSVPEIDKLPSGRGW